MSNFLKKTLAALLLVAVSVLLLELGSLLLFERLTGESFGYGRLSEERSWRIEALLLEFGETGEEDEAAAGQPGKPKQEKAKPKDAHLKGGLGEAGRRDSRVCC